MSVHSPLNMADQQPWDNLSELPTKFNKYRRLMERNEKLNQPSTTTNGVQQSSNLTTGNEVGLNQHCNGEPALKRPFTTDLYTSYTPRTCYTPPMNDTPRSNTTIKSERMDDISEPLNLTLPSVRSHANTQQSNDRESLSRNSDSDFLGPRLVIANDDSYFVDEHFQRSLGSVYTSLQSRMSPASDSRQTPEKSLPDQSDPRGGMLSITGSVDDHFSKSLGDLWTKVKSSGPSETGGRDQQGSPTSVDDHFAKALGETWYRLKADNGIGLAGTCPLKSESPQKLAKSSFPR